MAFDHPIIPYGNYRIHIISHPSGKPSTFKQRLVRHLLPVTREGFGGVREPTVREVHERATHPSISLLVYVDEVVSRSKRREKTRPVGYFSTKNLHGNTVHLLASVIARQDQRLAWYPLCKRIAMALGPAQLRLEGGQPAFFTAQSAYPYIHRDLLADDMKPAQMHDENGILAQHLSSVADALGSHSGFDADTSIRHGAFAFDAHEGKNTEEVGQLILEEIQKMRTPQIARAYQRLFHLMGPNDALMAIRRYRGPADHALRRELSALVKEPQIHKQVLVELLLGSHRRDIEKVDVEFDPVNSVTGQTINRPVVTIQFKPKRWDYDGFLQALGLKTNRKMLAARQKSGNNAFYSTTPNSIRAPLDAPGWQFIQHALSAAKTARKQEGTT